MSTKAGERVDLLQGTLDLIVLRVLDTMGPQHAYGIARRVAQVSDDSLSLNQGTLYPALVASGICGSTKTRVYFICVGGPWSNGSPGPS
jgi:hypothetical protein